MKLEHQPVLIIALDAADRGLVERWGDDGQLPTLRSLMQRGCWADVGGSELVTEHGLWVSLLSGVSRSRHGYYFMRQLEPGTYDLINPTRLDARAEPFWARLREQTVAILDVPDNHPIPGLRGIQLANWTVHHLVDPSHPSFQPTAEPPGLLREVRRVFGPRIAIAEDIRATAAEDRRRLRLMFQQIARRGTLYRHLLSRQSYDLMVAGFPETHLGGHQFWRYQLGPVATDSRNGDDLRNAVRDLYAAVDREIGRLLACLPGDLDVLVVSTPGVEDQYPMGGLIDAFCLRLGLQAPAASTAPRRPIDLVRRLVPEAWRIAVSRRFPRRARERLLADRFSAATDWRRTRAFALPTIFTSLVRVNLRDREPLGTVGPGDEYRDLLGSIAADLEQLVDPRSGEPAADLVASTVDLFGGGPPTELPDLWVKWRSRRYFVDRLEHPRASLTQSRPEYFRGTDHGRLGFFAAAGPRVRSRGALGTISLLDLAPTFLALLGESVPPELAGRPLEGVLAHA